MLKIGDKDLIETPWEKLSEAEGIAAIAYAQAIAENEEVSIPQPWLRNRGDRRRLAFAKVQLREIDHLEARIKRGVESHEDTEFDPPKNLEEAVLLIRVRSMRLQEALAGIDGL